MNHWIKKAAYITFITLVGAVAITAAAILGLREDPAFARFLDSPSTVEMSLGQRSSTGSVPVMDTDTPLVRLAREFAVHLTPAPKPNPAPTPVAVGTPPTVAAVPEVKPPVVSAKFEVRGVSFNRSTPAESIALIHQPGGKCTWVRQGDQLGHLVVKEITNDTIVCLDGENTCELALNMEDGTVTGDSAAKVAATAGGALPPKEMVGMPKKGIAMAAATSARPSAPPIPAKMIPGERRRHALVPYSAGRARR